MSQPLSHPDLRRRNLALLLGTLLRSGDTTRKQIEQESGLSKATVSRLVDELIELGLVERAPATNEPQGRGRRPDSLSVPAGLGQVIGITFGVRRTVVLATDLACRGFYHEAVPTPQLESAEQAIAWLGERIAEARRHSSAPLRSVAVAVPARVVDGEIIHPPFSMSVLEHLNLAEELSAAMGTQVMVDSDANMALSALIAEGVIDGDEAPFLLNMGTVLTVANRRTDGSIVKGRSDAFGNFSLVPFHSAEGNSTLGAMLSTHGLEQYCDGLGYKLEQLPDLWERPTPGTEALREAFTEALMNVLRIICITADPPLVLLVGRLVPLVDLVLPQALERLGKEIAGLPRVLALPLFGTAHSPAHGAVHIALDRVHADLREQFVRDE